VHLFDFIILYKWLYDPVIVIHARVIDIYYNNNIMKFNAIYDSIKKCINYRTFNKIKHIDYYKTKLMIMLTIFIMFISQHGTVYYSINV